MDADKLNEAATTYAKVMGDVPEINSIYAFRSGADWLMDQPLSERLTEEEKEKIKGYAKGYANGYTSMESIKQMLFDIFGSDLFKEK